MFKGKGSKASYDRHAFYWSPGAEKCRPLLPVCLWACSQLACKEDGLEAECKFTGVCECVCKYK